MGITIKIILVSMHEEQSLVVVVKNVSQISTTLESTCPINLFGLHGIRHRTPQPSVMVTIYGRGLVHDDLVVLGIRGNGYYVPLIKCTLILINRYSMGIDK